MADPSQNLSPSLAELQGALRGYAGSFYAESRAREWGLRLAQFQTALERSAAKRFAGGGFSSDRLGEYLGSLHIEDLCLANACLEGSEAAWEYFVTHYRGYLRAAAGIITKTGRAGTGAQELADSLFVRGTVRLGGWKTRRTLAVPLFSRAQFAENVAARHSRAALCGPAPAEPAMGAARTARGKTRSSAVAAAGQRAACSGSSPRSLRRALCCRASPDSGPARSG